MNIIKTFRDYKKHNTRKTVITDTVLAIATALLAVSALPMMFMSSQNLEFAALHATAYIPVLGLIKLLSSVGIWIPRFRRISVLVLTGYMGGAMMANIATAEFPLPPAVFLIIIWVCVEIQTGDLLQLDWITQK
jgi:hypothetical protein